MSNGGMAGDGRKDVSKINEPFVGMGTLCPSPPLLLCPPCALVPHPPPLFVLLCSGACTCILGRKMHLTGAFFIFELGDGTGLAGGRC